MPVAPSHTLNSELGNFRALYKSSRYYYICCKMSKFGVLVMGPAGAGKVCAFTSLMVGSVVDQRNLDHLLLRLDTASSTQQAIMLLHQPRSRG